MQACEFGLRQPDYNEDVSFPLFGADCIMSVYLHGLTDELCS